MESPEPEAQQLANGKDIGLAAEQTDNPLHCAECNMDFKNPRGKSMHDTAMHGWRRTKSDKAEKARLYYQRKKAKERELKAAPETKQQEQADGADSNEVEFGHHAAFTAGYITAFLETYAKGNGISGDELTARVAKFLYSKSR